MRTESNLQDHEPRIVSGVRGVKSKSFSKKFANQAAMEKWLDRDDVSGDVEIYQVERA